MAKPKAPKLTKKPKKGTVMKEKASKVLVPKLVRKLPKGARVLGKASSKNKASATGSSD